VNWEAREDSPALEVRREVEGGGFLVVLLETGVFSNSSIAAAKTSPEIKSLKSAQQAQNSNSEWPGPIPKNHRLTERLIPEIKPIIHHLKFVILFLPTGTRTFTDIHLEIIIITPFPLFSFLLLGLPLGSGSSCYGFRRIRITCIFGFGIRLRVNDLAFRRLSSSLHESESRHVYKFRDSTREDYVCRPVAKRIRLHL
jgi:hypothetical protein